MRKPPKISKTKSSALQTRYDELWDAAVPKIHTNQIEIDPVLAARVPDQRRGLTLIARPSAAMRQNITAFLRRLKSLEPDQHYYHASEFHLTILSFFTATVDPAPFLARTSRYLAAVERALVVAPPIAIHFRGVTASPGALMIQGFVENDTLEIIRENLRQELRRANFADAIDTRYRLQTAHVTVARFRAPLRNSDRFATLLAKSRTLNFGECTVRNLTVVKNDWYMTRQIIEPIHQYRLNVPAPRVKK